MNKIPKFEDLKYVRPDFENVKKELSAFAKRVDSANAFSDIEEVMFGFDKLFGEVETNCALAMIRCYLDSSDEYYAAEMQYCMQQEALTDFNCVYQALLSSPFAAKIDKKYGTQYLQTLKDQIRLKSNGQELLAKEQALIAEYQQLKAQIKISFRGALFSEGEMVQYALSCDRATRKEASIATNKAFLEQKTRFEEILSELIQIRNDIAKENGFSSYAEYMNLEKGRHGYGQTELLAFCKQVKEDIVPFMKEIYIAQAKRLGLKKLASYDEAFVFPDGNAKPVGDGFALRENAKEMYDALSPDISKLYRTMADGNYINVSSSKNKISGMGFCTELFTLKFPYVFGNCNGSIDDASVLTHEVGHSYQMLKSMEAQPLLAYASMPNDVAEIPSKAMEQFTHPYAALFFGADAEKFCFHHLVQSIEELTHYCAIHEYETWLYATPKATPKQRAEKYFEAMASTSPDNDFSEISEYALEGSMLFRSMGVYMFPFYLISYALSAMSAMEFAKRMEEDKEQAWSDYAALCAAGGSLSYKELLQKGNLHLPFEENSVRNNTASIKQKIRAFIAAEQK